MQNSIFSCNPAIWKNKPKIERRVQEDFEDSMEALKKVMTTIDSMQATSTAAFKAMQDKRNQIKSKIASIVLDIQHLNELQEKIEAAKKGLTDTEEDRKKYANWKSKTTVPKTQLVPSETHSTFCMNCVGKNIVCHDKCGLEYTQGQGAPTLSKCTCMSGGSSCTVCKCSVSSHFHDKKQIKQENVEVENILNDVKAQYDALTNAMDGLTLNVTQWSNDLSLLKKAVEDKHNEIQNLCVALKKICSRFNFAAELKSIIDLVKLSRAKVRSSGALKQLDDSIKAIEHLADQFSN